jgi:toxin-antitoxin system PIN domain toxin
LIALIDQDHEHYQTMQTWFDSLRTAQWGICPLTELGFVRITTNPAYLPASLNMGQAIAALTDLQGLRGYTYCNMNDSWLELAAPFRSLLIGHRQITDSYLLGLAVHANAVLVTLDKAIAYLAGNKYHDHLLVLGI